MLVVGITGGIGSGKSAVSERFLQRGITVVDADVASRAVVETGSPALEEIARHFGRDILLPDGSLNRQLLRQLIFAEAGERKWLESLLHPLIDNFIAEHLARATSPYAILVSPLLIESGQSRHVNRILVVDVPEALQLKRVMHRDGNTEEEVKAIMSAQASRETRLETADDVIINNGGLEKLDREVDRLHQFYLSMSSN